MIYLDHAATTKPDDRVLQTMQSFLCEHFGNASALYSEGRKAFQAIERARKDIGHILGAQQDTIIFTGSGTESDNLGILGAARANAAHGKHIITSVAEHHAVLASCAMLEQEGFEVTYLPVDRCGNTNAEHVAEAIRPDTILVTIMYANNEIGSINPIADIGRHILRHRKNEDSPYPLFHTDACQAAGYLQLDVEKLHVDLMTVNGSKIYATKGVGMLYKRRGVALLPLIVGGGQEFGLRAGTQNTAAIVGLAEALKYTDREREARFSHMANLTRQLFDGLVPLNMHLNGEPVNSEKRLPNNLNMMVPGVEAEALVLYASEKGIAIGTGSACATGSDEGSHVLQAIGRSKDEINASIRLTLGKENTQAEIEEVIQVFSELVPKLRGLKRYR